MELINAIFNNTIFVISASIVISFLITFISIPSIVLVAKAKNLVAKPNGRTSHSQNTPTLGGIAIFGGILITLLIFLNLKIYPSIQYITPGLIILFFIGLKDDILSISWKKKLLGQITTALIVILLGDIRFTNLHGCFGIYDINYISSVLLSLFVIIVIINCFNLIDGIDGLCAGIAIIASVVLGIWFFLTKNFEFVLLSSVIFGSLVAYFYFNVFGKKNKMFMGDTGSLIIGFLMAVLIIKFNEYNVGLSSVYAIKSTPAVSIGILFVPLFDTLRVFTIRISRNSSPFKADRGHIHHKILKLGKTHLQTTLILLSVNILFIILVFLFQSIGTLRLTLIILVFGMIFSYIPIFLIKRQNK